MITLQTDGRIEARRLDELRRWSTVLRAGEARPETPDALVGPWSELDEHTRIAIRDALGREMRRAMNWHVRGPIWPRLVHASARTATALAARGHRRLAKAARKAVAHGWSAPLRQRERSVMANRALRWRRASHPHLFDLLAYLGLPPYWLEGDWADAVPVDPRAATFYHDRERNVVSGHLIGFDLILADDGVWCVEANLNTSFAEVRRAWLDPEPAIPALLAQARAMKARSIWWVEQNDAPAREWLVGELGDAAAAADATFRIFESWKISGSVAHGRPDAPVTRYVHAALDPPPDTLVLRRNALPLGPDRIIANKEPFIRGIASVLRETGERRVRVPEMTREPRLRGGAESRELPNLVYKYPDMGKGEGVHFLRADSEAHAVAMAREIDRTTGEPPGLFQPFVCSRILPGRRIYDVRCEMIVTPLGVEPVFALRREASKPLPDRVDPGHLAATGVFSSNVSTGGRFAPIDPAESDAVWGAAHAVAEALRSLLLRAYARGEYPE